MRSALKHTAAAAVFIAGLIAILSFSSLILMPKDNSEDDGIHDGLANGLLSEPANTIDVLIVGDSEVYAAFMPLEIWQQHGITSYCCGTGSQKLGYTYSFISKCFETQSPKLVILETNAIYRELTYDDVIYNRAEALFPFFAYHSRWKSLDKRDLDFRVDYTHVGELKGYLYSDVIDEADDEGYMADSDDKEEIAALNRSYVKKMQRLCEKNNAELLLLSSPSTVNWSMPRHNSVQELADEIGAEYVDMNTLREEIPIDWQNDTQDKGDHMNYTGAKKVTAYLGGYLAESGRFTSHKGDKVYNQWDEAAAAFREKLAAGDEELQ